MSDNLKVIGSVCPCGTAHRRFQHRCAGAGEGISIIGCPTCDNHCEACSTVASQAAPSTDHCCGIDEVIAWLSRIRRKYGNRVRCMISFDGQEDNDTMGAVVPYMPINQIAVDDDDPADPIALMCVALGQHPFRSVIKLRVADRSWTPQ